MGSTITGVGQFGTAVSLSGDAKILGVGANSNSEGRGAVHMLQYNNGTWNALGSPLHINGVDDNFGSSLEVSSSGERVAVGASNHHGCYGFVGKVVTFQYDDGSGSWFQAGDEVIGEAPGDRSGFSVALSGDGNVFASGAVDNVGVNGRDSGHVRVYESRRLTPPGGTSGVQFSKNETENLMISMGSAILSF